MKHPNNGPSFSKPPRHSRRAINTTMALSPARQEAAIEQAARDASKEREVHRLLRLDPRAALVKLGLLKENAAPKGGAGVGDPKGTNRNG